MHKEIIQTFKVNYKYKIYFTDDLFDKKNKLLFNIFKNDKKNNKKLIIIIDKNITYYHSKIVENIKDFFKTNEMNIILQCNPILITGGEKVKNHYMIIKYLYNIIHKYKICRQSYIMTIGGGSLLDAVGFASSTAHRGVKLIRIPTTTLSQDDSGVGVKNGINFDGKKNFIGTFHVPNVVINDYKILKSLSNKDWMSGISEAIKVALIKDKSLFEYIYSNKNNIIKREDNIVKHIIFKSAKLHADHISKQGDPFEILSSRPLDFGHWAAHKLETLTKFKISHGEAVAIGIALDVTYSYLINLLNKSEWKKIIEILINLNFKIYIKEMSRIKNDKFIIFDGLSEFQEHLGGRLTITLLKKIGLGFNVNHVNKKLYIKSINLLKKITFIHNSI